MELKDLIGVRKLSGVDVNVSERSYTDAYSISFTLDGVTYTATEDENDGYRSALGELGVSDIALSNSFPDVVVSCDMRAGGPFFEVLDCRDLLTDKVVLSVGTDYTDDYYSNFVAVFTPENMVINQDRGEK